jgi:hypothetical protein
MPEHGSEQEIQQYAPASKKRQVHMRRPDEVHMRRPDEVHMRRPDEVHMRRPDVLVRLQIVILIMCNF